MTRLRRLQLEREALEKRGRKRVQTILALLTIFLLSTVIGWALARALS